MALFPTRLTAGLSGDFVLISVHGISKAWYWVWLVVPINYLEDIFSYFRVLEFRKNIKCSQFHAVKKVYCNCHLNYWSNWVFSLAALKLKFDKFFSVVEVIGITAHFHVII